MKRHLRVAVATLFSIALFASCGGLEEGEVVVVDSSSSGGVSAARGGQANDAGSAGESTTAGSNNAGAGGTDGSGGTSSSSGGTSSSGGATEPTETGGTSSGDGVGGADAGAPGVGGGPQCETSPECAVAKPICDAGSCRGCTKDAECLARDTTNPRCRTAVGLCSGCLTNADCAVASPICGANFRCRACAAHSDCDSLMCLDNGRCVLPAQAVYALAQTGSNDTAACGTRDLACASLATAAAKLTAARPYLVLIPTQSSFNSGIPLPNVANLMVAANKVKIVPFEGPAVAVAGGTVRVDGLVADLGDTNDSIGVSCTGNATLTLRDVNIANADAAIGLNNCNLNLQGGSLTSNVTGVTDCPPGVMACATGVGHTYTIERVLFEANTYAIGARQGATGIIRNNLFVKNGNGNYSRVIDLEMPVGAGIFAYNTLFQNNSGCTYVGTICCSGGSTGCGTHSSNILFGEPTCPEQVYYSGPPISNTLAETIWNGTGNLVGDPKFVNAMTGDFTPGAGSPAINKGNPDATLMPKVDFYGKPRPVGAPDIGAIEVQ